MAPYADALDAERLGWYEFTDLVRALTPDERLAPGYYREPDWSVRDVTAHLGTWLAEAEIQFQRMTAGTYEVHDVDVDGLNAALLEAMRDQPWDVVWVQANSARTQMLAAWLALTDETPQADWWISKGGPPHYAEHLPRLRDWVDELRAAREAVGSDV